MYTNLKMQKPQRQKKRRKFYYKQIMVLCYVSLKTGIFRKIVGRKMLKEKYSFLSLIASDSKNFKSPSSKTSSSAMSLLSKYVFKKINCKKKAVFIFT